MQGAVVSACEKEFRGIGGSQSLTRVRCVHRPEDLAARRSQLIVRPTMLPWPMPIGGRAALIPLRQKALAARAHVGTPLQSWLR